MELGAGTGLTSSVAAQLGASVVATELPEGIELLRRNLEANASGRAAARSLTWGTRIPDADLHSYDVTVLARAYNAYVLSLLTLLHCFIDALLQCRLVRLKRTFTLPGQAPLSLARRV